MCVGPAGIISPVGSLLSKGLRPLSLISPAAALMTGGLFKKKPLAGGFGSGANPNGSFSYGG